MSSKIDLALELKGIAYDTYNALKSFQEGGPLKIADFAANLTTAVTSASAVFGIGGLGRDAIAFKANEIKFSLSVTELLTEANKANPDTAKVSQALLGIVSSSAGIVGAIPGIPLNIKIGANAIALVADAGKEGINHLPGLLNTLEREIKATGLGDWNVDILSAGADASLRASENAKSAATAVNDLGEIIVTAKKGFQRLHYHSHQRPHPQQRHLHHQPQRQRPPGCNQEWRHGMGCVCNAKELDQRHCQLE